MYFVPLLLLLCTLAWSLQATGTRESCPDRLLGDDRRRTCPRPCKIDGDCGSKRQCLCDGHCGLSCVVPGRSCPWPVTSSNNSVARLLSPSNSFSALLEVRCSPGFAFASGLDVTIRRCQGDRQWSGDESVICTAQLTCSLPEDVLNTFSIQGSAAIGSSILYSCLSGEDVVGRGENICLNTQTWLHPHPSCDKVYCLPPQKVENGYVVAVEKAAYEVGFDIHFLCKKNFLLDGSQKVTCLSNSSWSAPPPYCRARCVVPAERSRVLISGIKSWPFDLTDGMVSHGEGVAFYCKHPRKQCSFIANQTCFDGALQPPMCYLEPTWLQYKLFPHRLVSEIEACEPGDVE